MADSEWFVGEDGVLSVGGPTDSVTYHSGLNTILVVTKEPAIKVLDVTSGLLLKKSDLCGETFSSARFHLGHDGVAPNSVDYYSSDSSSL